MRFCNWVSATGTRHFVNRNYYHPLTFDISWLLRYIPTSIYALKMLRPGTDVSPFPLATPLPSKQNYKFASSYAYSQISWSRSKLQKLSYWHILQNKNCSCTCSEMLNPVPYFYKYSVQSNEAFPVAVASASKPNCSKFVVHAEFLSNQRGTYRSGQKQPELNLCWCC